MRIAQAVRQTEVLWKLSAKGVTVKPLDCEKTKQSKRGTGGWKMTGADIFTLFMIIVSVFLLPFIIMLALPDVIELIAESIIEMKWSIDKLKDAIRGDKDGS